MKKIILVLLATLFVFSMYSQKVFIYGNNGEKVYLSKIDSVVLIKFKKNLIRESRLKIIQKINAKTDFEKLSKINHQLVIIDKGRKFDSAIIKNDSIVFVNQSLLSSEGDIQIPTEKILVKIKQPYQLDDIMIKLSIRYASVKRLGYDKDSYVIELENGESIEIANKLFESGFFDYAQPSFTRLMHTMDNPFYSSQWGLNNTGQYGGSSINDINAPEAWATTTGNSNIKIALIDQGVDLTHPDLSGNLLAGYDATVGAPGGANGSFSGNDSHGTACAGIIVGVDNNIGIKGVAPSCKLIPIRISYIDVNGLEVWNDDWTVDAINHAWSGSGADILSCSWVASGGSGPIAVNNEINAALTQGRANKGCVVIFAAGNNNSSVSWPANSNSSIISVGAMSPCGERKRSSSSLSEVNLGVSTDPQGVSCDGEKWWGSSYGNQLDLVAPGVKIYTTDLQGTAGYNKGTGTNGNYNASFNGTSSATPHVAGVAALILSINPFLTQSQVCNIIESTCTKVGNYNYSTTSGRNNGTWNNEVGYGLINAFAAVQAVPKITISGPTQVCGQATYSINNLPAGATVMWSSSNTSVATVAGSGSTATLTKNISNGSTTLSAIINESVTITKSIWVGAPIVSKVSGLSYCLLGSSSDYYASIDPLANTTSYSWTLTPSFNNVVNPSDNRCYIHWNRAGTYVLEMHAENACGTSTSYWYPIWVGGGSSFSLSPNPASSQVEVSMIAGATTMAADVTTTSTLNIASVESLGATSYQIKVVDSYGLTVYSATKKEKKFNIQTSTFRNGVYSVIVSDGTNTYQNKLIVTH